MAGQRISPPEIRTDESPHDPDSLPDSSDPSGPCPRCGRASNFSGVDSVPVTFVKDGRYAVMPGGEHHRLDEERVTILECQGCRDRVVVVEEKLTGGRRDGDRGAVTYRGFHWWPTPGGSSPGPDVPDSVADAFSEGMRCLSANAPNGAVGMFRTALSYMVEDRGSEKAKGKSALKDKVKQMVIDGGLPPSLREWADHVRLYGNAGAHPDLFGDVAVDEATDVSELTRTLIEVVYVVPANIARRQAERPRN